MSLNQAISEGLLVTGVGLVIVFGVLVILMLALMAMKALFYKEPKVENKKTVENLTVAAPKPVEKPKAQVKEDDLELIAVLAAAIAASLNTNTSSINIKSFRRVGQNSPAWNRAGVAEMINSRI